MRQNGRIEETEAAVTITTVLSGSNLCVLNVVFPPVLLFLGPSVFPSFPGGIENSTCHPEEIGNAIDDEKNNSFPLHSLQKHGPGH